MLFHATRPKTLWLALLLVTFTFFCQARIWHVAPNGNDDADGLSWANALASPQIAFDRAEPGDELWLTQGCYSPDVNANQALPSGEFHLRDGINILGGFGGDETVPEERELFDRNGNGIVERWEFTHETILTLPEQVQGTILTSDAVPFELPTLINGLTIVGGHNSGTTMSRCPGLGGGAFLAGNVVVQDCEFIDNFAQRGGAIYATHGVRIEACCFSFNTSLSGGGAVWLSGPSSTVVNCVFLQNGTVAGCTNGGGALWLTDQAEAAFSSFARNAAVGPGTGIHAEAQSVLRNCVIWQGTGHGQDCQADATCQVIACAVMDGGTPYLADTRNFGLCANNAGASGLQGNDNTPALHYPCFATPDEDNYSLEAGSFLINRGEYYDDLPETDACGNPRISCGLPDIGAYESNFYGNLVIAAELTSELYYGLTTELVVTLDGEADWELISANPDIASVDQNIVRGEHTGNTELIITYTPKEEFWADGEFRLPVTVLPRPLTVAADILEWHSVRQPRPALTWKIVAGQLVAGDSLDGELACAVNDFPTILPAWLPITQGNLQIIPENNAECYNLTFVDGGIQCLENRADILLEDCQTSYQGVPIALEATTIPNGLALEYRYQNANTGEVLDQPPVLPGEYLVTATVMDDDYCGEATATLTITKAPLQCRADDIYRAYRKPNPELTCTFTGFVNGETAEVLDSQPVLETTATLESPIIPEGYPISISIGEDDCYDITALPGTLYVTLKQPNINEVAATVMTYGEPLELVWLMAYSTDPDTDEYVPGEFIWEDAEYVLDAGLWICPWTFVPDDLDTYGCVKGKSEVTIMRRPIRVEASDRKKPYGDPEVRLPLTVTLGSLARGDRFLGDMERIAGEQPGTYPIKQGMLTIVRGERDVLHNYELIFVEGTYTIELRQVTIAADSLEKLGGQPDPVFTWQIIVGTLLDEADLTGALAREPGETAGEYRITQGTLMLPETYQLTFIEGILTIRQTLLEIAEDDQGNPQFTVDPITYGEPLDGATQIHGTVVSTTTGEEVPGTFTWDHDGEYPETGEQEQGWTFTPDDEEQFIPLTGEVTITVLPALLTVTANDATRAYGTPNPQFGYEITGFVLREDASVLTAQPTISCEATVSSIPGDYAITASGAAADNYVFQYVDGTLTVTKGHIAGESGDQVVAVGTLTYGQTLGELPLEGTFTDEAGNAVPGTLAWDEPDSHPDCSATEAGWTFTPDDPECHEGTAGTAAITVNPALLIVTTDDATRAYGTPNPVFGYEITGFVLREDTSVLTAQPNISCEATVSSVPGDYAVTASGAAADNYVFAYVDGTLAITKGHIAGGSGDQVVSVGTLTYGQTLGELPLEGAFTDEAGNPVPGTLAWDDPDSHPDCSVTEAGWTFTPDDLECHEGTAGTTAIVVSPALLTVTADDATRAYGTPNPQFTYEITGFVLNEDAGVLTALPEVSCEATVSSVPGDYAITASGATADNYVFAYVDGTLTVTKGHVSGGSGDQVVAVGTLTYGQTLGELPLNGTFTDEAGNTVPGHLAWDAPDSHPDCAATEAGWTFTPDNPECHEGTAGTAAITVNPALLIVTADDATRAYGTPNPQFTCGITGFVLREDAGVLTAQPTISCEATIASVPGDYAITASGATADNYVFAYVDGTLTVTKGHVSGGSGDQVVSVGTLTYGQTLGELPLEGTFTDEAGNAVPGTLAWDEPDSHPDCSVTEAGWTFTPDDPECHEGTAGTAAIVVNPALLTVTADDATRAYGTPNPQFGYEITGFVLNEDAGVLTALPEVSCEATVSSVPGNYAITASGAAADNYVFAYVDGTLTVTKGHVSGGSGDQVVSVGTLTYGQTLGELPLEGAFTDEAGNAVTGELAWDEPETHPTCSATEAGWTFTPDNPDCYDGTVGTAAIVVNPALLTVTADDATRAYGTPNPQFTCGITGFVLREDAGVLTAQPTISCEATIASVPGDYAITANGAAADNYVFAYVDGTLTITKGHVSGGSGDQVAAVGTLTYGQTLGELPLEGAFTDEAGNTVPGLLAWDDPDSHPDCSVTEAGWTFTPDDPECHEGTAGTAAIVVNPALLTVTADDATRAYGTPNPPFTYEITGFVLGEDAGVLTAQPELSCEATVSSVPGDYAITASGAAADNYVFQYVDGTLTITRRMLVIQADNLSKRFGAIDPEFTFQLVGDNPLFGDSFSGNLLRESGEAVGQYAIHQGTLSISDSYTIVFHPGIFTIQPSELEIARDESGRELLSVDPITYGDPLNGAEQIHGTVISNATAEEVAGAFAWEKDGEFLPVGTHELTWIFQPDDQDKYTPITGIALLTVNPATLLAKALDATREYAQENPPFELEITGFVMNEDEAVLRTMPAASTTADRYSYPGEYPIDVAGGEADNYVFAYQTGTLEITAAQYSSISRVEHWAYMNYGQKLSEANVHTKFYDAAQQLITGTIEWLEPDSYPNCATTSAEILFTPDDLNRYTPFFTAIEIVVFRVNLGLACKAYEREYNQENPEMTYYLFDFVLDDTPETALTVMPTVYTSATIDSPPGYYDIWASGGEAPNYNIKGSTAILTIIKAGVEPGFDGITASPLTYGQPLSESVLSGTMIQLDKIPLTEVPGTFAWLDPTIIPNCGTTACQWVFTPDRSDCYTQYYGISNVTVQPANLTVNVANVTRLYGEENPTFRYEISGFVGEDSSNVLSELPITECDATVTSAVGEYAIRCAEVTDGNYQLVCQEGHLTVKPRTLAITADSLSKSCHEEDPELTYVTAGDGLVNGDTLTGHLERDPGEEAGQYIIRQGTLAASENYDTMFTAGTLTIERLTPTLVEAHGSEFIYGQRIGESDYGATFANPLTGEVIPGTLTIEAPDFRPWAGTARHHITFHPDEPEKYTDAEAVVKFIIRQRPLHVQILPPTILFGQKLTELDYTIANGDLLSEDDLTLFFPMLEDGTEELGVGEYPILATPRSNDRNIAHSYQVVMEETCLTVLPAPIEVFADDVVAETNGELPPLTYTVLDGEFEDAEALVETLVGTLECDADLSQPGDYPIVQGNLITDSNHTLLFHNGTLSVRTLHDVVLVDQARYSSAGNAKSLKVSIGDTTNTSTVQEVVVNETLFRDLPSALQALRDGGTLWLAPGEYELPDGALRLCQDLEIRCNQAEDPTATARLKGTLCALPSLDSLVLANLEILGEATALNLQTASSALTFEATGCLFAGDCAVLLKDFQKASFYGSDFLFRDYGLRLLPSEGADALELSDLTFTHEEELSEYWHIYCDKTATNSTDNRYIHLKSCTFDGINLTADSPDLPVIKSHIFDAEDEGCHGTIIFQP